MIWNKKEIGRELVREIVKKYGCDTLTASILVRRGIIEGSDLLFYLEHDLRYTHNPFLFSAMEDAVDRVRSALDEEEHVLIYGDRDADGITATTLLYEALTELGLQCTWNIPREDDSYGLSKNDIDAHAENYGSLIITVDCGISNIEEIDYAQERGIDVVVLDHHTPRDILPNAVAIINPKIPESGYPFTDLCGCTVAWKFVTAFRFSFLEIYNQQICLLNVRPVNEAYVIEAAKLMNMVELDRLTETIVPGKIGFSNTRMASFLQGQQIFVWDAEIQKKQLQKIFGNRIDFNFFDVRPQIAQHFPKLSSISLLRLKSFSRAARYSNKQHNELDALVNIFISFVQQANHVYGEKQAKELQLVALATLADLMRLENENRILVYHGLNALNTEPREGIAELLSSLGWINKQIGTTDIAWHLTPLINATGRMGKPEIAVELFLEHNPTIRAEKAQEVFSLNEARKTRGIEAWNIVKPIARDSMEHYHNTLAVAVDKRIFRGITGILAGRLARQFNVPAIVVCLLPDGRATGSLRSARNFEVLSILQSCADLFVDFGGHLFAAGFTIMQDRLPDFLNAVHNFSASIEFSKDSETTQLEIDAELPHTYLNPDLLKIIDVLEPYGNNFLPILFMTKKMKILDMNLVGKTEPLSLKLTLDSGQYKWTAMYWQAGEKFQTEFNKGDYIDIVFHVERNTFNGNTTVQLIIKDAKKAGE